MAAVFAKLKQIPTSNFTEPTARFLCEYTGRAMKMRGGLFDLQLLWNIQFEPKCGEKVREVALEGLGKLLSLYPESKAEYIGILMANFDDNISIERSIQVLLRIGFATFLIQYKLGVYTGAKQLIDFADKHFLVERTLARFIESHKKVAAELAAHPERRAQCLVMTVEPETGMSFGAQVKLYLDFLSALCTACDGPTIAKSYLDVIWTQFTKEPMSPEHSAIFWDVLKREGVDRRLGFFGSARQAAEFFKAYLGNTNMLDIHTITPAAFSAFRKFFEVLNVEARKALSRGDAIQKIEQLPGIQMLWLIVLHAESEETHREATECLTAMYYGVLRSDCAEPVSLIEAFLIKLLTIPYHEASEFRAAMSLLRSFMLKYSPIPNARIGRKSQNARRTSTNPSGPRRPTPSCCASQTTTRTSLWPSRRSCPQRT